MMRASSTLKSVFKMFVTIALFSEVLIFSLIYGKKGYGPGEQNWGYIDIFEGAHMFYWLYYTAADVKNYTERPLVLWLEGGLGSPASGNGNLKYFGPIDIDDNERKLAWVNYVNLLLIDNPLGAGYSYVDDPKHFSKTNTEIAHNLVETMKGFYRNHPEFLNVPLHIFAESHGGKMGVEFALELWKASVMNETAFGQLKSLNMGNPLISIDDQYIEIPKVAYEMGTVDEDSRRLMENDLNLSKDFKNQGLWKRAFEQLFDMIRKFCKVTAGISFLNVIKPVNRSAADHCDTLMDDSDGQLYSKMNSEVKSALEIPSDVVWGAQRKDLAVAISDDILKPVIKFVEQLLNETDVEVSVFSGNLDLLCPTAATESWIQKLNWSRKSEYTNASRDPYYVDDVLEGFERSGGGMSMIWILRAGHLTILDNPRAVAYILRKITETNDEWNIFDILAI